MNKRTTELIFVARMAISECLMRSHYTYGLQLFNMRWIYVASYPPPYAQQVWFTLVAVTTVNSHRSVRLSPKLAPSESGLR